MSVKRLRNRKTSSLTNLPSVLPSSKQPVHASRFPAYRVIYCTPILNSRMVFCVPVSRKHIVIADDVIFIR